jgi:abortive infection bacteriophage resistance protein
MKEFKTYQEQIELLKIRGLKIDNEQFALKS